MTMNLHKESFLSNIRLCRSGLIKILSDNTFAQIQSWWITLGLPLSPGFPASRGKLYCMTALYWSLNINTPCNFKKKRLIIFFKWPMKTQMLISSQEWISYWLYFEEVQFWLAYVLIIFSYYNVVSIRIKIYSSYYLNSTKVDPKISKFY